MRPPPHVTIRGSLSAFAYLSCSPVEYSWTFHSSPAPDRRGRSSRYVPGCLSTAPLVCSRSGASAVRTELCTSDRASPPVSSAGRHGRPSLWAEKVTGHTPAAHPVSSGDTRQQGTEELGGTDFLWPRGARPMTLQKISLYQRIVSSRQA